MENTLQVGGVYNYYYGDADFGFSPVVVTDFDDEKISGLMFTADLFPVFECLFTFKREEFSKMKQIGWIFDMKKGAISIKLFRRGT